MSLSRRRARLAIAVVALASLGGVVVVTRPSGSGRPPVEVQAGVVSDHRVIDDPLPEPEPASTTSTAAASTTTSAARHPITTTTRLRPTTTTTMAPACAPASPVYVLGLARRPDGSGWVAGANPALQRSVDGGQSWTPACLPADAVTGPGGLYGITFGADGRHAWVVGGSGGRPVAFLTVDGGDHWLAAAVPDGIAGRLTDVAFADPDHGWAVGNLTGTGPSNAGGAVLLATADGGATWTAQSVPAGIGRLTQISVVDAARAWSVGVASGGQPALVATADGGATWSSQTVPDGIRELRDIAFVDRLRGWAVGALPVPTPAEPGQDDPGVILTTTDGGVTWTRQATMAGSLWTLAVIDGQTLFAGGGYGLFSTSDGGTTWAKQPFTLPALDSISFTDATHGWVAHSMFSTICRTDDGGRSWTASVVRAGATVSGCARS